MATADIIVIIFGLFGVVLGALGPDIGNTEQQAASLSLYRALGLILATFMILGASLGLIAAVTG